MSTPSTTCSALAPSTGQQCRRKDIAEASPGNLPLCRLHYSASLEKPITIFASGKQYTSPSSSSSSSPSPSSSSTTTITSTSIASTASTTTVAKVKATITTTTTALKSPALLAQEAKKNTTSSSSSSSSSLSSSSSSTTVLTPPSTPVSTPVKPSSNSNNYNHTTPSNPTLHQLTPVSIEKKIEKNPPKIINSGAQRQLDFDEPPISPTSPASPISPVAKVNEVKSEIKSEIKIEKKNEKASENIKNKNKNKNHDNNNNDYEYDPSNDALFAEVENVSAARGHLPSSSRPSDERVKENVSKSLIKSSLDVLEFRNQVVKEILASPHFQRRFQEGPTPGDTMGNIYGFRAKAMEERDKVIMLKFGRTVNESVVRLEQQKSHFGEITTIYSCTVANHKMTESLIFEFLQNAPWCTRLMNLSCKNMGCSTNHNEWFVASSRSKTKEVQEQFAERATMAVKIIVELVQSATGSFQVAK